MASTCVAVLGCHRSGTSALAGTLHRLGLHMGHDLMPASPFNPRGYYEPMAVVGIHDGLLRRIGSKWDTEDVPLVPAKSFARLRAVSSLRAYLRVQAKSHAVFGVKDPRMCLFPELWMEACGAEGITLKALLSVRHTDSIVKSLQRRDGFTADHAGRMVAAYTGCMATWCMILQPYVATVPYRALLEDWRAAIGSGLAHIGLTTTGWNAAQYKAVDDFLLPELCHHGA